MGDASIGKLARGTRRSQPLPLRVDLDEHASEIERFRRRIVLGPLATDCSIWVGGISDDGYGVFRIRRDGVSRVVRTSRYALALASPGLELAPDVMGLHGCDHPLCVKVCAADAPRQHVVAGDQIENMRRMARMRRGGGRSAISSDGLHARRQRSVALRAVLRERGWDRGAVEAALPGDMPTLW